MEASALTYHSGVGLHGRSPLLRLQSDERLISLLRRGNVGAFEVLFARYETRLLSFCRHLLGSREDAEDVLQEVMTAAFNAILADDRPINVRPWLYRIARNRSLNHLRRATAIASDTLDLHVSENGASTADKVHERERFRLLVGDIQELPETQRTALVLREMDALSYEQIAEAMETTVSSVKSLLVRARVGLAEAAEARVLTCEQVRIELGEVAEGLLKKPSPLVRRHLKSCDRCCAFRGQLKATNKALAALLPVGPLVVVRKLALLHLGHSAGAGAGGTATAAGSTAGAGASAAGAGAGAAIGASGAFGGGSLATAGFGAVATKAAAGLAAAVIVTAGAVEVDHSGAHHPAPPVASVPQADSAASIAPVHAFGEKSSTVSATTRSSRHHAAARPHRVAVSEPVKTSATTPPSTTASTATTTTATTTTAVSTTTTAAATTTTTATTPGRVQTQTDPTILPTTTTPAPVIVSTTPATPATTVPSGVTTTGTASSGTASSGTTSTPTTSEGSTTTGTTTTGTTTTQTDPTTSTSTTATTAATTTTAPTPTATATVTVPSLP